MKPKKVMSRSNKPNRAANPYREGRALTVNMKNLTLVLHDEVLRQLRIVRKAYLTGDEWGVEKKIGKIRKIILEIVGSLRKEGENEISDNLRQLYLFSHGMLETERAGADPKILVDLAEIFQTLREGWKGMDSKRPAESQTDKISTVC